MRLWTTVALAFGLVALASAQGIPVMMGQEITGSLEATDAQLDRTGEYYDSYTFAGNAGQVVSVRLNSSEIDPYVIFYYPDGSQTENDDFQGTLNSGLDITLPETGSYRVLATSYAPGETGTYTLSLAAAGAAPPAAPPTRSTIGQPAAPQPPQQPWGAPLTQQPNPWGAAPPTQPAQQPQQPLTPWGAAVPPPQQQPVNPWGAPQAPLTPWGANQPQTMPQAPVDQAQPPISAGGGPIALNQPVVAILDSSDPLLQTGESYDLWQFQGQAGQQISVSMSSDQVDCYLIVIAPDGQQSENDDYAQSTNSQVSMMISQPGMYQILATTYAPGESGTYQLIIH